MKSNSKTRIRRQEFGFTLVELMVAMTILAFGMLGVAATQLTSMHGNRSGRNLTAAVEVAQNEMEGVIRVAWSDLPVANWTTPVESTTRVTDSVAILDQTYMVSRRVTEPVAEKLRAVDIQVSWNDSSIGARSYSITTLRFNDGS
jgi:prepilin-type N-terminal cleavage/methylation domain-containing protein